MSTNATASTESDSTTNDYCEEYKELLAAIANGDSATAAELIVHSDSQQIRGSDDLAIGVYEQLVATPRLLRPVSSCLSEQAQRVGMPEQARIMRVRHRLRALWVSQHEAPSFG